MKLIKRKSKNEKNKDKNMKNFSFINNKIINLKHTDLVPFSNINTLKSINKNINIRKSSLSIDNNVNLSSSVHSLFESNNRSYLPIDIYYLNNDNINNNYIKK